MLKNSAQIGQMIRKYRLNRNLSQADLAHELGVTISAVSTWERGISKPGIDVLYALAQSMELTLDDLLTVEVLHQELQNPHAFLEHLDFKSVNIYITHLHMVDGRLHLSLRITGPELSVKKAESQLRVSINDAQALNEEIKPSKQIPAAEEMLHFHAVDSVHQFAYTPYENVTLTIAYMHQSYTLTIAGKHVRLIDLGPAVQLSSMIDFSQMMSSEDFQIAFQFLAQNGHFKKLETNMQSMIQKVFG